MLGIVSRLTDQKGLDLVECVLDQICAEDVQLVVLGTGEGKLSGYVYLLLQKVSRACIC